MNKRSRMKSKAYKIGRNFLVRCVVDDEMSLTKGKTYEVLEFYRGLWGVVDDEEDYVYLYSPSCFEIVGRV